MVKLGSENCLKRWRVSSVGDPVPQKLMVQMLQVVFLFFFYRSKVHKATGLLSLTSSKYYCWKAKLPLFTNPESFSTPLYFFLSMTDLLSTNSCYGVETRVAITFYPQNEFGMPDIDI